MRPRLRLLFAALLSAMLSVALVAPAEARPRHDYPDRIELPVGFQPEGITIGKAPVRLRRLAGRRRHLSPPTCGRARAR